MSGLGIVYYYALGILLVIPVAFYLYVKYAYTYWERIGAPYLVPRFPFGNFGNPVTGQTQATEILKQLYDELKSLGHKHGGSYVFTVPFYIPTHQDYLKNVMSKDFSHFTNRGMYHNEKPDPLSAHRFAIEGEKWKKMRHQLTPAFSPGTIKAMFYIMVRCSTELENLARSYSEMKDPLEIKNALSSFTMDVVGSSSFGIDCNSIKDPNSKFLKQGRKFFNFFFFSYFPKLERMIGTRVAPKEMSDFYLNVAKDTVTYRENNKISRKDLIQILIDLKNKPLVHPEVKDAMDSLTVEQIAAQVIVFFLAGFETYSTGMTFCLFELAQNQYIQQRLRDEVNTVLEKYHGEITFDGIQEMKYMDQVFDEALRKYPPVPLLNRKCNERYNVPGTDVVIEDGISVLIPVLAIHRDPEYYPDPEKFDPERFSEENKKMRHPFTYIPFGEGPRICIGLRFGVMQSKVGLAVLLKNYKFTLNKKTQLPLKMDPYSFVLSAVGGIWLDVTSV